MEIKKVALLGAGAVGSYIIWGLSKLDDISFGIIADGERARRLKEKGIEINDRVYRPQIWSSREAKDADFLIVALKYGALRGALDDIETAVGENTAVMSVMNGVDSEEIISGRIGVQHMLYSVIKIASVRKDGSVHFDPESTMGIIFGEAEAPYDSERVQAISRLFDAAGIHYRVTDRVKPEMWLKFYLNISNNLPQAILGVGVGCYKDSEHMAAIKNGLGEEVRAIALAKGVDINLADKSSNHGSPVNLSARYSTLQDIDAKRHTEIDMFSGAIVRMGRELGIPTPYNEYTYHLIKAIEEKNDGLFNYE